MEGNVCSVCSFIPLDGIIPEKCPVCGSPKTAFKEDADALKQPQDPANPTEAEKEHTPKIVVVKECSLVPEGCLDVHARVGEIKHPMQPDHLVFAIDFYIDKQYVARVLLTPEKANPAAALHLDVPGGSVSVVAHCNLHGNWLSEEPI